MEQGAGVLPFGNSMKGEGGKEVRSEVWGKEKGGNKFRSEHGEGRRAERSSIQKYEERSRG